MNLGIRRIIPILFSAWPIVILVGLTVILGYLNFKPGTFLIGWDNFHAELNPGANLRRALDTTWQEYQSLGLLGGMGHGADLFRQLGQFAFYWLNVPTNLIRYLGLFIMLGMGTLGTYWLSLKIAFTKFDLHTRRLAAFFAGLFYLLNLGTVQVFYAPFETFTAFYAFFPWILFTLLNYLWNPSRQRYVAFVIVLLLSGPSFYIQTHLVVLAICFLPIFVDYFIGHSVVALTKKLTLLLVTGLTVLLTQAYWLFPAIVFSLRGSSTTVEAFQNQVATPDVISRNQEFGQVSDVALLRGFWFDYADLGNNNRMEIMISPWRNHLETDVIRLFGYGFFALTLVGAFFAFKRKLTHRWLFLSLFGLSLFFLINDNPPTGWLYRVFQDYVPLFRQFFRSSYTKWISVASFSFATLFGLGVIFLIDLFSFISYRAATILTSFTVLFMLFAFNSPSFQGYLLYDKLKQPLPTAYTQVFEFFAKQNPNTRIANFPQHTFWGWYFTDWGYRGSGFLWYGIEQPILDRAFDVWSKTSQDYYFEIRRAIYAQDVALLEYVLNKYSVSWLLLDKSVIIPATDNQGSLYLEETEKLFGESEIIKPVRQFGGLKIYSVSLNTKPQNFVDTVASRQISINNPSQVARPETIFLGPGYSRSTSPTEAINCDNFNQTQFDKEVLADEIRYSATNAMSCDHLVLPELPHDWAYTIEIDHKKYAGQPLLLCIESHTTGQCDYFGYLPDGNDWMTTSLELPKMKSGENGYTIHLYNYSIGRVKVENAWRRIEIRPTSGVKTANPTPVFSLADINTVKKNTYSFYDVELKPSDKPSVVSLNQAFDTGWKLFVLNSSGRFPLINYLKALIRTPVPDANHFSQKGWENSWVVPAGTSQVVILFMPQIWQWIGFALLSLLPILVFSHRPKKAPEEGR